jgi:predicted transcriptional regulator
MMCERVDCTYRITVIQLAAFIEYLKANKPAVYDEVVGKIGLKKNDFNQTLRNLDQEIRLWV